MKPSSYYTSDGDIAFIFVRPPHGEVHSNEEPWGLRDFDETGELVGIELWGASKRLPPELIDALPRLNGTRVVIERRTQPA
jgi:uncharacterized protein YuzE